MIVFRSARPRGDVCSYCCRTTGTHPVGLCHGVQGRPHQVADAPGVPAGTFEVAHPQALADPPPPPPRARWATGAERRLNGREPHMCRRRRLGGPGSAARTLLIGLVAALIATLGAVSADARVTFSIDNPNVSEGGHGETARLVFTVTATGSLPPGSPWPVRVNYRTLDGTATAGGQAWSGGDDYETKSPNFALVFEPGQMTHTVTVTVNGDDVIEGDESVKLDLYQANYGLDVTLPEPAIGWIINDDAPTLSIIDPPDLQEGDSGETRQLEFTVEAGGVPKADFLNVAYRTRDGTATAGGQALTGGNDYESRTAVPPNPPPRVHKRRAAAHGPGTGQRRRHDRGRRDGALRSLEL